MVALPRQPVGPLPVCRSCGLPKTATRIARGRVRPVCPPCERAWGKKASRSYRVARGTVPYDVRDRTFRTLAALETLEGLTKRCSGCREVLGVSMFPISKFRGGPRWHYCRPCERERDAAKRPHRYRYTRPYLVRRISMALAHVVEAIRTVEANEEETWEHFAIMQASAFGLGPLRVVCE